MEYVSLYHLFTSFVSERSEATRKVVLTNMIVIIAQIKEVIPGSVVVASEDELTPSLAIVVLSSNLHI